MSLLNDLEFFSFICLVSLVCAFPLLALRRTSRNSRVEPLPYPPGPPGHLLWGNYAETVGVRPWLRYQKLSEQYGDIVHLSILGQHFLILNTVEAANDLLTKRSQIYSDRARLPMIDLMGWTLASAFIPYGHRWRMHRRALQHGFSMNAIPKYRPAHTEKLHIYLKSLLSDPEGFQAHTHEFVSTVVMKIVYEYEVDGKEDRLMATTQEAVDNVGEAVAPGAWLVNSLPFLRFFPAWFPGCREFNRAAQRTRYLVDIMANDTYDYAKRYSRDKPCLVTILEDLRNDSSSKLNIPEDVSRDVCGTAFAAATETTVLALSVFFLAMRQYPEVQDKARAEIDAIVGPNRLPDYDDRASLPYTEAIYLEVMRWLPVLPMGIGHVSIADDVYRGYFVPKGTIVLSNIWAMTNDESKYTEPHCFMPERFLNPDGGIHDEEVLAFGFGRRICAGRHFADASVWRTIGCLIAAFDIKKPSDSDDLRDLKDPRDILSNGSSIRLAPFRCSISPRSPEMAALIQKNF